ncbi:MAG: sensor histidine kinase [Tepidiformaceae bacterium]
MGSLQFRLFFTYLFVIGVTLGLAALSLFLLLGGYRDDISYSSLEDIGILIDAQANNEVQNAIAGGQDPGNPQFPRGAELLLALRGILERAGPGSDLARETSVAIVGRDGHVIPGAWASASRLEGARVENLRFPAPAAAPTSRTPRRCRLNVEGEASLLCVSMPLSESVLATFPGTDAAALVVAQPAASLGEVLGDLMPRLLFSGLIGVVAALCLGFAFSRSVAAPLRNIARAARSVARGNYRQRVPATGPREVRDLASNFNRMTEEVQRSQQTLRDFLANISHELKTPLTSIRGFSEAVLDGTIDDGAGIQRSARVISDESNRLLRLVQELLDLSRIESGQVSMLQEPFSLDELFEHVGEVFALRSEESGISLDMRTRGDSSIRGDFDRLEQVLNNLLDNAFRHTPEGGAVHVGSREVAPGVLQVTVSDSGGGIPPEDVPHLFERFYRASTAGNGRGHGLGLAITREIVRAHGGDIWATSEEGRGTTFAFTLPSAGRTAPPAARR